jgi:hypothetical protein
MHTKIELVYFDIHARGEVVRLLFAAANRTAELTDTRVPLFFESPAATKEWTATHKPRSPLGYVPYLRVRRTAAALEEEDQLIPGAAACASFAARYLGLAGGTLADSAVANGIATAGLDLMAPAPTKLALVADPAGLLHEIAPAEYGGGATG